MKKFFLKFLGILLVLFVAYLCFLYFASYSEGVRAGRLVKFSHKGVIFKTWEGEISQGVSDAQVFIFSVESSEKQVIDDLTRLQGKFVKLHYFERFGKLFWLGDTKYFVTKVEEDNSINQYLND
ncbi:6-phosphogluconate dehydrogenase [Hanstruepera neustonica]|uniref:6-phosphogluconate dehydrogenase n=1 Tax=Hanstruepera neustonica TaxID=1445657 RepID=A0A2K1DWM9_9FLAO|nr:6-phosphogluconate dehydrogenase [Hanstruepera neustonica]PNQ72432.1 6-phosphogluconate dehydrogenase [Hanstruepera neustonica]